MRSTAEVGRDGDRRVLRRAWRQRTAHHREVVLGREPRHPCPGPNVTPMNDRSSTMRVAPPYAPRAIVFVRLAIAFVFITEGIQKFLAPETLGVGRFATIGIPSPEVMAPVVGGVEIAAGALVLI